MQKVVKNKKILVLGLSFFTFLFLALFYFLGSKEEQFIVGKTLNISNPSDYLVQYDDGNYHLMKANADIKFSVESDEKQIKYTVVDEDNREIKTQVRKKKKHFEIVADKNYEEGKTYKITLENASFTEEKLKEIQTLYFTIVRPNANTQILNNDVVKVNKGTITNIEEDESYYTLTSKEEFKENDILYYQNGEERLAFKVDSLAKENDGYIIKTSAPTPEELFKELDVYGDFHLKLKDFIAEEELKDYVRIAIEEEGLLDKIVPKAQAAGILSMEVEFKNDGSAKVKVSLRLSGGEKAVFDHWLEDHDVKLDIELIVKLTAHSDIGLFKQDIGLKMEIEFGSGFSIEPTSEDFLTLKQELEDNQEIDVALSREKIKKLKTDKAKTSKPFAKTTIFAPGVGLAIQFQVGFLNELEIALESSLSAEETIIIDFGYNSKNGFYRNFDVRTKKHEFSILGKGEEKFGLEPKTSISFLGIMVVGVDAPLGVYGEGQINYMNAKNQQELDGNFELGAFVDVVGYAKIKFLKKDLSKLEVTYEKKIPIITLEGTIQDDDLSMYAGTYKNMTGDTKELYVKDNKLYYDLNDEVIEIDLNNKRKDGGIIAYEFSEFAFSALYIYPIGVDFSAFDYKQNEMQETDKTKIRLFKQGSGVSGTESVYYKVTSSDNCEKQLLEGDFSCYAGTYTYMAGSNSNSSKLVLDKEGKITGGSFSKDYNQKPVSIRKEEDGTYRIEHQFYFDSPAGEILTSRYFYLAPIDVTLTYYSIEGKDEETDKSKVRIKKGGFIAADENTVYQKEE